MIGSRQQVRLTAGAERLGIPLAVTLELTHRCPFRCLHCYIADHEVKDGLGTDRLRSLLEELTEAGTLYLTFTGGEPLLRSDWSELATFARELGFVLTVMTSGATITAATAATLRDMDAFVEVSFYAAEADVFDFVTRVEGSYQRVRRGVELLRQAGVDVLLKHPLMTLNRGHIELVQDYADSVGAGCQVFSTLVSRSNGDSAPLALQLPGQELARLDAIEPSGDVREVPGNATMCGAGTRSATVLPNGDVVACSILPGVAGSILRRSFKQVWRESPWLQELRRTRWADLRSCASCSVASLCGRCPAQALVEDGDLAGPSSAACTRARERLAARVPCRGAH